jgi:ATP-dependent helicase/nuclease subunit A
MKLTPKQEAAVRAEASVAVTAGAGTGKTAMLAARYLHHVLTDGFSPLEIAAVTFTEKAAAELRARIRSELTLATGAERAAETDAAQISTIHAMAARICRDFYDIAGIPADFRMLDETDSDILLADWFDEVMSEIEPEIVTALGYTWLRSALRELFEDPPAAEDALSLGETHYRTLIENARDACVRDLMASECWREANDVLNRFSGRADDKLEPYRVSAVNAMGDIAAGRNIPNAVSAILDVKLNIGSKGNWPQDSLQLVKDCLKSLRESLDDKGEFVRVGLEFGVNEAELCRRIGLLRIAFTEAYDSFRRAKLDRRVLDFADLEYYALKILEHEKARKYYASRWKAILVDEFQDTNPVQEKILQALSEGGARLTIVGDGKQSIYGFRRADPRVFERFRASIDNDVILDRTFRTHAGLVEPLNTVFESVLGDTHQPLDAERADAPHDGPFVEAHIFSEEDGDYDQLRRLEAAYVAGEIRRMLDDGVHVWDKGLEKHRAVRPSEIAILSRSRKPLDNYIDTIIAAGVPAVNTGGGNLLDTPVAMDLSSLLRFIADPSDDIALAALLRGPFFAVSDVDLYELSRTKQKDDRWWALISRADGEIGKAFQVLSDLLAVSKTATATRLIEIADEISGYTAVISNLEQGERRMADWFGFLALLRKFASLGRSDVIGANRYLRDLERAESVVPRPPIAAGNAVSLMTIHAAKGLEWPVVFVPNLGAGKNNDSSDVLFDAEMGVGFTVNVAAADGRVTREETAVRKLIRSKKRQDEDAESARILYVALTRARDRVYLTSAGRVQYDIALLIPGLEAAGIAPQMHDSSYVPVNVVGNGYQPKNVANVVEQVSPIAPQFDSIPVTGLVEYTLCPKRFRYSYVDGHPGLGEGVSTNAKTIGTLAHAALELGIRTAEELMPIADGASRELIDEAIKLAKGFDDAPEFKQFQLGKILSEVPVTLQLDGVTLIGKADLVGPDYVLDFKTDTEAVPDDHLIQLWVYAKALSKPRAVVAYLRQRKLHEYSADQLRSAAERAEAAAKALNAGSFAAKPTESGCRTCTYAILCTERYMAAGK